MSLPFISALNFSLFSVCFWHRENKYIPPGQRNREPMSWGPGRQNSPRLSQSSGGPSAPRPGPHDYSPSSGTDQRVVNGGVFPVPCLSLPTLHHVVRFYIIMLTLCTAAVYVSCQFYLICDFLVTEIILSPTRCLHLCLLIPCIRLMSLDVFLHIN